MQPKNNTNQIKSDTLSSPNIKKKTKSARARNDHIKLNLVPQMIGPDPYDG